MLDGRPEIFTAEQRAHYVAQLLAQRALEVFATNRPGWMIHPHEHGQLQALSSDHIYRVLIPGNGWGKTTCMALDADMLMQRNDPFKPQVLPAFDGPDRPTTAIWVCQKYQQFEVMQPAMEGIFTRGWKWRAQHHCYEWSNGVAGGGGSRLFILSGDSDWTAIQGVEIDAVYFDEHPDRKLWNEMLYRRRGQRKTRYMVAATMTQGITWFVTSLIQEWEKYCRDQGLSGEQAKQQQPHPKIFMWPSGGIHDNPSMGQEDVDHYASITTASEKEREVRSKGGYSDFAGSPVFDIAALNRLRPADGESGAIIFTPDSDPIEADRFAAAAPPTRLGEGGGDGGHRFRGVVDRAFYKWVPQLEIEGGRITIFEPPDPELAGNYVMGADFAAGLVGMDYDAACLGVKTAEGELRQVAEAQGHWGDIFFAEVLFMLGVLYFEAFIVGERQFGLPCLRRLYDEMGYAYMYYNREEAQRARRMSDKLGHHRGVGDTIIPIHRLAVKRGDVQLVSPDSIQEHKRYQFRPRNKNDMIDDLERSADLTTSAPSGEHDDLVMAAAYMTHGAREMVHFARPKRGYRRGTFGDLMQVEDVLEGRDRPKRDPYAMR